MSKDIIMYHWYGIAFIVIQKWRSKICKLRRVDDTIPFLQLARYRSKNKKETEMNRERWFKLQD